MRKSKWLVVLMLMAVVLIFVGCSAPQDPAVEEAVVEAVTSEDVMPPEEDKSEETTAVMETDVVLGMLSPDAILVKDEIAPDFALKTLEGEVVQLSDYRGKLVLLNFWTTW